ncbi:MAG: acyltransferase family protein, partial [Limisphaerales bacterium]
GGSMNQGRLYFGNVNFLRAVAAILVLVYHVIELTQWHNFPAAWPYRTFYLGWLGVDLFFVISGFVIGLAAIKVYRESDGSYRRSFMKRRLARIVPLYLFTAVVFLFFIEPGLLQMKFKTLMAHVFAHLGFVHNWFYKTHGSINGPNWSVAVEMQFYLLAILFAPVLSKVKPWKLLFWGIVLAWLTRFAAFWWTMDRGDSHRTFIFSSQVPGNADQFAFGIFLSRLYLDGTLKEWAQRWQGRGHWILFAGVVAIGTAALLTTFQFWPGGTYWKNVYMVTFWRTGVAVSFAMLVALFCLLPDLSRSWYFQPLNYLGEISYGIYLWHLPVILSLKRVLPPDDRFLLLKMSVILTLILASLSWHLIEKPVMQRFR